MLYHKKSHGSGVDFNFPTEDEIDEQMKDLPKDYHVPVFGDGSQTTPETWWASLGGSGVWFPDWNKEGEKITSRCEKDLGIQAIGQRGSSTRQELAGWLLVLTKPARTCYATDSAAMLGKAVALIQAATKLKEREERGEKVIWEKPFKKVLGPTN